jgi:hypothetical protein
LGALQWRMPELIGPHLSHQTDSAKGNLNTRSAIGIPVCTENLIRVY